MNRSKLTRLVITAALVLVPLMAASVNMVDAALLADVTDLTTDSGLGALTDHDITFTVTSGIAATDTITLDFDSAGGNYDFGSLAVSDITMSSGVCSSETSDTLAATPTGTTWGVVITGGATDTIVITSGTDTVPADGCVILTVGGTNQIANPSSAAIYDLDIDTTSDSGTTKLAVLDHVTADVTVDETLTFTVAGQATGNCVTTTDVATTSTSVSFGSVAANTFVDGCQELTVSTNATGGYSVTLQDDGLLTSVGLDTIAAGSCDSGCTVGTEGAWATATNNGFAYCLDDVTGTDAQATNKCTAGASAGYRLLGELGTDTPEIIMSNVGVVSSNAVEVNYKISVSGAQPAGTYSNEIIYVATPTY